MTVVLMLMRKMSLKGQQTLVVKSLQSGVAELSTINDTEISDGSLEVDTPASCDFDISAVSDSEDTDNYQRPRTKHTPAFKNFERKLDPAVFSFTCNEEEAHFTISCILCSSTFTTTSKRGLSRVEEHIASWGHKERNGSSLEIEKRLKESDEKKIPGIFVFNNSSFSCRLCNVNIEASAKSRGDPITRCESHVKSASHMNTCNKFNSLLVENQLEENLSVCQNNLKGIVYVNRACVGWRFKKKESPTWHTYQNIKR